MSFVSYRLLNQVAYSGLGDITYTWVSSVFTALLHHPLEEDVVPPDKVLTLIRLGAYCLAGCIGTVGCDNPHFRCTSYGKCTSTKCVFNIFRDTIYWRWLVFMQTGMLFKWHFSPQLLFLKRAGHGRMAHIWLEKRRGRVLFSWRDKRLMQKLSVRGSRSSSVEDIPVSSRPSPT